MKSITKLSSLIAAASLAALLASCGGSNAASEKPAAGDGMASPEASQPADGGMAASDVMTGMDGDTYNNAEFGFSFMLPEGWAYDESEVGKDGTAVYAMNGATGSNVFVTISDNLGIFSPDPKTLADALKTDYADTLAQNGMLDPSNLTVDVGTTQFLGKESAYTDVMGKLAGADISMHIKQFYLVQDSQFCLVTITAADEADIQACMDAFKAL